MLRTPWTLRRTALAFVSTLPFILVTTCTESDECVTIPSYPKACGQCGVTCPNNHFCEKGECRLGACSPGHFECVANCCPIDQACSRGRCVDGCADDGKCGPGMACNPDTFLCAQGCSIGGKFFEHGDENPGSFCSYCDSSYPTGWTDVECPDGQSCSMGKCVP